MKKLIALAAGIRLNAALCCGAAILLSACGAGVSDPVNGLQSHTAAELTGGSARSPANDAAAMPYGADPVPGVADAAAPALPATAPATAAATPARPATRAAAPAAPAAANIEPAYDSKRQSESTAGFSDQAESPVEGAQEVAQDSAPAACATGTCQH